MVDETVSTVRGSSGLKMMGKKTTRKKKMMK